MKNLAISPCPGLHAGVALPAVPGVALQQHGHIKSRTCGQAQQVSQLGCIFYGHASALRQIGAHGVGGIAQQGHPAQRMLVSALHRGAVAQGPEPPVCNRCCQILQCCVAACQCRGKFRCIGAVVPGVNIGGQMTMHDGHHIEPGTAAHRVMHDVHAGTQPDRDIVAAQVFGQAALQHQCAVGKVTGAPGLPVAQQLLANGAPQPIGADQHIALKGQAVSGANRHRLRVLVKAVQRLRQMQPGAGVLLHRFKQQAMQVCAMHSSVGRAITGSDGSAQTQRAQNLTCHRIACLQQFGKCCDAFKGVTQAPMVQHLDHIGPQLNTRTHFTESRCSLKQLHIPLGTRGGQGHGQPANAAADNQRLSAHAASSWRRT